MIEAFFLYKILQGSLLVMKFGSVIRMKFSFKRVKQFGVSEGKTICIFFL